MVFFIPAEETIFHKIQLVIVKQIDNTLPKQLSHVDGHLCYVLGIDSDFFLYSRSFYPCHNHNNSLYIMKKVPIMHVIILFEGLHALIV